MRNLGKLGIIALALMFVSASLMAQAKSEAKASTYKGYLVDKMCGTGFAKTGDAAKATAKAKKHTKDCAMADNCKASGFGLLIGAKFHKFDDAGDKLALSYLDKTKKESNLWVEVKGTMDGENINVASLKDTKK